MSKPLWQRGWRRLWPALILAVAAAVGIWLLQLLATQAAPESTPAYSSLRTDAAGTSLLFNSLARAGLQVRRGTAPHSLQQTSPQDTVAFVLAPAAWPPELIADLATFLQGGGRLVVAGASLPAGLPVTGSVRYQAGAPGPAVAAPAPRLAAAGARDLDLSVPEATLQLPSTWQPLYSTAGRTYMAIAPASAGAVILASSAEFTRNRYLVDRPDPAFWTWALAGRRTVWVDETAHGVTPVHDLNWLIRGEGLQPALLLLLLGFGLCAWRSAVRLEQPLAAASGDENELADAHTGMVRLLRRAIPAADLRPAMERQRALGPPRLAHRLPAASKIESSKETSP